MARTPSNFPLWLLFGLLLALGLGYVLVPSDATTWKLATSRQPDGFTELYFNGYDPTHKFVQVGQKYRLSYSIVNRQNRKMHYVITTEVLGAKANAHQTVRIDLPDQQKATQFIEFTPAEKNVTYRVKVSINPRASTSGDQVKPQTLIWRFKS